FTPSSVLSPPLPSFPTRRSSDLARPGNLLRTALVRCRARDARREQRVLGGETGVDHCLDAAHGVAPIVCYEDDAGRLVAHAARRSEEHTSELQSRENLVCRLLLE